MYGDINAAATYFSTRLNVRAWDNADSDKRTAALTMAATYIDRLNFAGDKADENQTHEFPRGTDTDVPEDIKTAAYEIALQLLKGRDIEIEDEMNSLTVQQTMLGRMERDPDVISMASIHGIPSIVAWRLLVPYLRTMDSVNIQRLS